MDADPRPTLFATHTCGQCHALIAQLTAAKVADHFRIVFADESDDNRSLMERMAPGVTTVPTLVGRKMPGSYEPRKFYGYAEIMSAIRAGLI